MNIQSLIQKKLGTLETAAKKDFVKITGFKLMYPPYYILPSRVPTKKGETWNLLIDFSQLKDDEAEAFKKLVEKIPGMSKKFAEKVTFKGKEAKFSRKVSTTVGWDYGRWKVFLQNKVKELIMAYNKTGAEAASTETAKSSGTKTAGHPDLLAGSLKAIIKHAKNAKKTPTQEEFLKCARKYQKEISE